MSRRFPEVSSFGEHDMKLGRLPLLDDVWLNPQRPLEASGTSGIKALNGCLNFACIDGWWLEGCQHGINGCSLVALWGDCNQIRFGQLVGA